MYKAIHYHKRARLRKRLPARVKSPLVVPGLPNETWSLDFVSDRLESGRQFRVLNILDDFNREAVAQEISMSMPAQRVIKLLEKVIWLKGKPITIRTDNGPEFISKELHMWCEANGVQHVFTQPGKPTQNSYVERFNGSYRRAVLDAYIFRNIGEVREITDRWMLDYNERRPHEALNNMSPRDYKMNFLENNIN